MAEPESAVLPITPYPIGRYNRWSEPQLGSRRGYRADVQTTKDSGCAYPARAPAARLRACCNRLRLRSRPSSSNDSNSGGLTDDPVAATSLVTSVHTTDLGPDVGCRRNGILGTERYLVGDVSCHGGLDGTAELLRGAVAVSNDQERLRRG